MGKYVYNKDFFEKIDTEAKAYWLGFLYADGCINRIYRGEKVKAMDLELGLARIDENHLYKFLNDLESNIEVKRKTNRYKGKTYESSRVHVCCTKMCRDLIKLGCTPQKSLDIVFPSNELVPENLIKHFIRGYFDGDGCISPSNQCNTIICNIVGTKNFLVHVCEYLHKNEIINFIPKIYKKGNAFEVFFHGNENNKKFLSWLYDDAIVYLDRKYKKYVNYYENNEKRIRSNKANGVTKVGVYYNKRTDRYIATIYIDGKRKQIGSFKSEKEAIKARIDAEKLKNSKVTV